MELNSEIVTIQDISDQLMERGFCFIDANTLSDFLGLSFADFQGFATYWNDLHEDKHLKDLGRYRFRRHSSYIVDAEKVVLAPHRAHWQSLDYNALHGGMYRMFDPIDSSLNESSKWTKLIGGIAKLLVKQEQTKTWYSEAHQFRITTSGGIGRPTPEGAHRDGVDFVAVILIKRESIKGGETRIFEIDGNLGFRFTLEQPWSVLLLDDHRMIHETTPIQEDGGSGYRDTLVLTFKGDSFQQPG